MCCWNAPRSPRLASSGGPDARWGEAVVAIVVLQAGASMSEADVLALFDGRIARYKQPREVRFSDALPRTALGKVMRDEVLKAIVASVEAWIIRAMIRT